MSDPTQSVRPVVGTGFESFGNFSVLAGKRALSEPESSERLPGRRIGPLPRTIGWRGVLLMRLIGLAGPWGVLVGLLVESPRNLTEVLPSKL